MKQKLKSISNEWFFSDPNMFLRCISIFVKGDGIVLIPFFLIVLIISLFSVKVALLTTTIFISVRFTGEMIYWLLQQFGSKTYRPYDYGLSNLSNDAIYIIYQLTSTVWIVFGIVGTILIFQKNW